MRLIHDEPDGPQINSAFSSSISWRSMPVHDDDSSLATPAPATADPISEPPPRSSSPTTHRPPGARHQHQLDNAIRRRLDFLFKAKSCFNILLNILQSSYIAIMFLRAVFSMFALQTIFFHVYHLKDDIQLSLRQIPEQSC